MRKETQNEINAKGVELLMEFNEEILKANNIPFKRLLSCQAWVCETENFYGLRSYNTMIACIDKRSYTLVDALRYVYGYTATSAKHIAKFNNEYGWCDERLVIR